MSGLTVAVTGPTGTFGFGLVPLLQADDRIGRIIGIARRPFDPAGHGWSKMDYRRGDVRDLGTLEAAFAGADVVIHLAFLITGNAAPDTIRQINVDGTRNAFRAAVAAGAYRFVFASSVAAYGFHRDNPVGLTEDWPVRPAARLFYAREKAELERALRDEAVEHPEIGLYLLRPSIVVGPHALGAKNLVPAPLATLGRRLLGVAGRVRLPVLVPDVPLQLVHETDVGAAILRCAVGGGPPGAYNLAAPGVLSVVDLASELGLTPVPVPAALVHPAARLLSTVPVLPPAAGWVEAASHPAIMDTTRAQRDLGWKPRYTAREALRDTLRPEPGTASPHP
ncbi:MAG TPA: NAD-dependent epimerase/dehydratase family protein [Actinophytocola sp.]|uniref:NAD-dependent epimerase/dehydratase family protein n=1 Tax=Actinophytocola sp. TaxID=1872138 RepID=UPI002DBCDCC2|nr:NAD-dependent epimerase/dehydratase family protein [Actinophytocola sp.]HEU5470987.1 NAD-dependent epimerase/dehydratase family protein [Actinophytocola sp.]